MMIKLGVRRFPLLLRGVFNFSKQQKGSQAQPVRAMQQKSQHFTNEEKKMIQSYKPDELWNTLIGVEKEHNFQKELILNRKQFERTTKQLRSAILFQDLLKNQIDILIYDTAGKVYIQHLLRCLGILTVVCGSLWVIWSITTSDPDKKVILERTMVGKTITNTIYVLSIFLSLKIFLRHIRFTRRFVEKITYSTANQNFTFVKRNFMGIKYNETVSRYKIVYTESPFLNKKGTNYFHIDNQNQYSIGYTFGWKKQDLFSHLIGQRIKI